MDCHTLIFGSCYIKQSGFAFIGADQYTIITAINTCLLYTSRLPTSGFLLQIINRRIAFGKWLTHNADTSVPQRILRQLWFYQFLQCRIAAQIAENRSRIAVLSASIENILFRFGKAHISGV